MESVMRDRASAKAQSIAAPACQGTASLCKASLWKTAVLLAALVPLLLLVLAIGIARFFQSLNDGTISPWRLVLLFAHLFGCLIVVTALYGRGRGSSRPRSSHRGRPL
jgi:hypothetical protein